MNVFVSFLGGFCGILIVIGIVIFIIYYKLKGLIGKASMNELKYTISNISNIEKDEYSREKNVKGLTNLMESEILHNFPDFNKELLFSICENNLRKIFNVLELQDDTQVRKDINFIYLAKKIKEEIIDMKTNQTYEKFDNIEFNRHAIYNYTKKDGKATITVSSSLGYFYKTNRKDKKSFPDIKKQTRYTSEFVYVYDESKFTEKQSSFLISCPNCGAPLKGFAINNCAYCGAYIEKINLKVWKMSSYNEDYK